MIYIIPDQKDIKFNVAPKYGGNICQIGDKLAVAWSDGTYSLVKNFNTIKDHFNLKHLHAAKVRYYMWLLDLEILSPEEYLVMIDAIEEGRSKPCLKLEIK